MPNLATILKDEIRRLARKELRGETSALKKAITQYRHDIAELKRQNRELRQDLSFLKRQEQRRAGNSAPREIPEGSRFSVRSLKAQRRRTGLSQGDYARLVGVSTLTVSNWENGKTRPADEHLAKLISLRGLGKREAQKRLELTE